MKNSMLKTAAAGLLSLSALASCDYSPTTRPMLRRDLVKAVERKAAGDDLLFDSKEQADLLRKLGVNEVIYAQEKIRFSVSLSENYSIDDTSRDSDKITFYADNGNKWREIGEVTVRALKDYLNSSPTTQPAEDPRGK